MSTAVATTETTPAVHGIARFEWIRLLARAARTPRGKWGIGLTLLVVVVAIVGPFVTPDSPTEFTTQPFAVPSADHVFGGDKLGRDVLSRVLAGGWLILALSLLATAIGVTFGTLAGMAAAYGSGWRDTLIMRAADVLLVIPPIVFALLVLSVAGPKWWLVVLAVGLAHLPQVARVMRASALDVSERDFVKAVQVQGVGPWRVMTEEIAPNLIAPLMVEVGLRLTYSIIFISGLSFLGLGQAPPAPSWGAMINENSIGLEANPWATVAPILAISVFAIGTNIFTDAVARVSLGIEGRASRFERVPVVEAALVGESEQLAEVLQPGDRGRAGPRRDG